MKIVFSKEKDVAGEKSMNYMEQVAHMLDVEAGEKFKVKDDERSNN